MWRWIKRLVKLAIVLAVLAAIPVAWIETQCVEPRAAAASGYTPVLAAADRREEVNTYLTYPEWSIVHAYEDFAAVTRAGSESDYGYFGAIWRYWTSLCDITRMASRRGTISNEYKAMLHIIGLSFAGEMGVKGIYETTIGRLTAYVRGPTRTPEDDFALSVADDYAKFLRQTPWYQYPFAARLWEFWTRTPFEGGHMVRKIERRMALSLEWGAKAVYAKALGALAAAAPAPLRIKSVVADLEPADLAADRRLTIVKALNGGAAVIETDRYRTLTEVLQGLARRGRNMSEIAGNQNILVTIQAPAGDLALPTGASTLFEVPIGAKPGWRRVALDVKVPSLLELMRGAERGGWVLEHVYDY
jgi:hypothetical protein